MRRIVLVLMTVVIAIGSTLVFSDRAGAQPESLASVSPSQNLLDGGTVSVDGTDWPATTSMSVQECVESPTVPEECYPAQQTMTNAAGSFTTSYVVHRFFDHADCVTTIDVACFMLVERTDLVPASWEIAISFNINSSQGPDLILKRRSDQMQFYANHYDPSFGGGWTHDIVDGQWVFAVLVQNDGPTTTDITVHSRTRFATAPFTAQFFYGYDDVSAPVTGSGFVLPSVAPGESRLLGVRFTFNGPAMPPFEPVEEIVMTVTTPRVSVAQDALTFGTVVPSP
jgi:hypothetical protein